MRAKEFFNIKKNKFDLLRLRNIIFSKISKNSSLINRFINYSVTDNELEKMSLKFKVIDVDRIDRELISDNVCYVADRCLEKRINVLGSGWIDCSRNFKPLGLMGTRFNSKVDDKAFLVWSYDIKTGYKWRKKYISENEYKTTPENVDIKVPWEIGRMNFLSSLALASIRKLDTRKDYLECYKQLIVDFDKKNSACVGVNWVLAMEASIRISNILFSYDIIKQFDEWNIFDKEFENTILRMCIQHIRYIYNNLEKGLGTCINGNHYYSDLSGLLMCFIYLKTYPEKIGDIFDLALKEFFEETNKQFFLEGGNFEHSSGYFNLTSEMLVFVVAGLLRCGVTIPDHVVNVLNGNLNFLQAIEGKNGTFFRYGDCDSGRFIKTEIFGRIITSHEASKKYLNLEGYESIYGEEEFLDEDIENYSSLKRYLEALFCPNVNESIEHAIICLLSEYKSIKKNVVIDKKHCARNEIIDEKKYKYQKKIKIPLNCNEDLLSTYLNKEVGLFVVEWSDGKVFFYFGNNNHRNGHSHNDSLHYEININNRWIFRDKGTFSYTGTRRYRNYFRSSDSHNVPHHKIEQKIMSDSFSYVTKDFRKIISMRENEITVEYKNDYYVHYRKLEIRKGMLIVSDFSDDSFDIDQKGFLFSEGYGKIQRGNI